DLVSEHGLRVKDVRVDIERIEAQPGEPFDPNRHEALMRQASDEVESGHVTTQFQPGYVLSDKTIRPAQVAVAE
ncbi:MAG: nucleotide exchange factor GrpE, partial [Phycisphaeraceae bacterium]